LQPHHHHPALQPAGRHQPHLAGAGTLLVKPPDIEGRCLIISNDEGDISVEDGLAGFRHNEMGVCPRGRGTNSRDAYRLPALNIRFLAGLCLFPSAPPSVYPFARTAPTPIAFPRTFAAGTSLWLAFLRLCPFIRLFRRFVLDAWTIRIPGRPFASYRLHL